MDSPYSSVPVGTPKRSTLTSSGSDQPTSKRSKKNKENEEPESSDDISESDGEMGDTTTAVAKLKVSTFIVTRLGGNQKKAGGTNKPREIVIANGETCTVAHVQDLIATAFGNDFSASSVSNILWGKPKTGKNSCKALDETLMEFREELGKTRVKAKWAMFCTTIPTRAPIVATVSSAAKRVTTSSTPKSGSPSPSRSRSWVLDEVRENAWADALMKDIGFATIERPPRFRLFNETENRPGVRKSSTLTGAATTPIVNVNINLDSILEKLSGVAPASPRSSQAATTANKFATMEELLKDLGEKEGNPERFDHYSRLFSTKHITLHNIRFISEAQLISFGLPFGHANMILQIAKENN
ncbi:hypothetical protein BDR26DRAFT_902714 [Obelidium mucronatum]|nr:hypothetical protein BDR26DRAFT_902714 [Obelidium mucronatum]